MAVVNIKMQPLCETGTSTLPEDFEIDDIEVARRPQFEIHLQEYDWY